MITIKQKGLNRVVNKLAQVDDAFEIAMEKTAQKAKELTIERCPVSKESGDHMVDSIFMNYVKGSGTFEIGAEALRKSKKNTADFAYFNEFGHTNTYNVGTMTAPVIAMDTSGHTCYRPFIRPSIWDATRNYGAYFGKKVYEIGLGTSIPAEYI